MNIKRRVHSIKGRFDIAPLIDIVFLLLIFFMLSSSFVLQPGIKVNIPKTFHSDTIRKEKNILITLTSYGNIYFNDSIVSIEHLLKLLLDSKKKSVLIRSDQDVKLKFLIHIWDLCAKAKINSIQIATLQKKLYE